MGVQDIGFKSGSLPHDPGGITCMLRRKYRDWMTLNEVEDYFCKVNISILNTILMLANFGPGIWSRVPGVGLGFYSLPHKLLIGFFNMHMGWLSLHRGHPVNILIRRTVHLSSVIMSNDTMESMLGHKYSSPQAGSNLCPLAPEACANHWATTLPLLKP